MSKRIGLSLLYSLILGTLPSALAQSESLVGVALNCTSGEFYTRDHATERSKRLNLLRETAQNTGVNTLLSGLLGDGFAVDANMGALHAIAYGYGAEGSLQCIDVLAEMPNFDPNLKSTQGATPLHYAVDSGNFEIARYLLSKYRVNSALTDNEGNNFLHILFSARITYLTRSGKDEAKMYSESSLDASVQFVDFVLPKIPAQLLLQRNSRGITVIDMARAERLWPMHIITKLEKKAGQ